MTNDGTIVESIESPNMYQPRGVVDGRVHQHYESNPRVQHSRSTLIDLTDTAERATHRRPVSSDITHASLPERQRGNMHAYSDVAPPQRRHLIELDDNVPVQRPAYRVEEIRQPMRITHEQYVTWPHAREFINEPVYQQDSDRVPVTYVDPVDGRVIRESVIDRQPFNQAIRYVAQEPPSIAYSQRNSQAFRKNDYEQIHQLPPHPYRVDEPSRRIIVLDTDDPMEDVQRTADAR